MSREKKIAQYLRHATTIEERLIDVLPARIEIMPAGSYRTALRSQLRQSRDHAKRARRRLSELDHGTNPVVLGIGLLQSVLGQALAVGRAPLELLRVRDGDEKLLKAARDDCATVARQTATYTAIEHLARSLGDRDTARLAGSIRDEEQKMLDVLIKEIPGLTEAVASAETPGEPSSRTKGTRAVNGGRAAPRNSGKAARRSGTVAKRAAGRAGPSAKRSSAATPSAPKQSTPQTGPVASVPVTEPRAAASRAAEPTVTASSVAESSVTESRAVQPWPGYEEQRIGGITSALRRTDNAESADGGDEHLPHEERSSAVDIPEPELAGT